MGRPQAVGSTVSDFEYQQFCYGMANRIEVHTRRRNSFKALIEDHQSFCTLWVKWEWETLELANGHFSYMTKRLMMKQEKKTSWMHTSNWEVSYEMCNIIHRILFNEARSFMSGAHTENAFWKHYCLRWVSRNADNSLQHIYVGA